MTSKIVTIVDQVSNVASRPLVSYCDSGSDISGKIISKAQFFKSPYNANPAVNIVISGTVVLDKKIFKDMYPIFNIV